MSDWKQSSLCLCRNADVFVGCHCLHDRALQSRQGVEFYRPQAGAADLPLLTLCKMALQRRQRDPQTQILILHNAAALAGVSQAAGIGSAANVQAVEICSLDRIGHVDILLALAMGFDRVVLQQLSASDRAATQQQEIELAGAMGGKGRFDLFATSSGLQQVLAAVPETSGHWSLAHPGVAASRRDSARACASVLLPVAHQPLKLPVDAPYGAVQVNASACTMCQRCVWLCPTDALAIDEYKSELFFVESSCIQCGMCQSICPENALQLVPRMDPHPRAEVQQILHQAETLNCTSCGDPFAVKSMMERLLARIWGDRAVQAEEDAERSNTMCRSCRIQKVHDSRRPPVYQRRFERGT